MIVESKPTPVGFVASVADKLAEIARAARDANPQHSGQLRETSSLDVVARYIKGVAKTASTRDTSAKYLHPQDRPITAPAYQALYLASGQARRYEPGPWQLRLLRQLAADFGAYADPGDVLAELACRAIRDREAEVKHAESAVETARAELVQRAEKAEALRGPLENATARVRTLADENATLRAEREQMAAQLAGEQERMSLLWGDLDELSLPTSGDVPPAGPDAPPSGGRAPRRVKIDDETGVYRTANGSLEIGYKDADGRQRWETVGDDLEQARALRAERVTAVKAAVTT